MKKLLILLLVAVAVLVLAFFPMDFITANEASSSVRLEPPAVKSASVVAGGVELKWERVESSQKYIIYRFDKDGGRQTLTRVGAAEKTTFTDTKATSGKEYFYSVRAYDGSKRSAPSERYAIEYIGIPKGVTATSTDGAVRIKWTPLGASGYNIMRKTAAGKWEKIAALKDAAAESYEDKNVSKGTRYRYAVQAFGKKTVSGYGDGDEVLYTANSKICYLTFDDGPSENTLKILNILEKYDAKATFFVISTDKSEYYKNIEESGNAIGLHSYTHNYSSIYRSDSAFFEDLERLKRKVEDIAGVSPTIMRFPGGSSNTISRSYSHNIMTRLTAAVEQKGYDYFDWNLDSGDAAGNNVSPDRIVSNIKNNYYETDNICVLMHDSAAKSTTVEALPRVIEFLQSRGYCFSTLDNDSAKVHHSVNN